MSVVRPKDEQTARDGAASDALSPLVRLAGQHHRPAVRQIVEAVAPAMLRAIRKVMGHRTSEVEDVLQDAVEGLLGALPAFKGECTVLHFAYQSLRQRFPESEEARLSAISQGDLLLGQGEPAKAVAAYADYLRAAPHGSLTEEALFGKARGLGLLGRSLEERQTWRELARRFPRSAYQPAAERRLRELPP